MKNRKLLIFIIIILIVFVFLGLFKDKILKIIYPRTDKGIVAVYAKEYDGEEKFVFAVIKAESNFDENAVSHREAIGLMQIMEETAKDVAQKYNIEIDYNNAKQEISNVQNNINIGTKYLSVLLEKYQNKEVALAAYNAGIGNVDNWIEKGIIKADGSDIENVPYKETNNYVRKILRNYRVYKELYGYNSQQFSFIKSCNG